MLTTSTGQAVCVQMNNWSPFINSNYSTEGLIENLSYIFDESPALLRFVLNVGPSLDMLERRVENFLGSKQNIVFLPQWFVLDITMKIKGDIQNMSLVQTITSFDNNALSINFNIPDGDLISVSKEVYINNKVSKKLDWDGFRAIASTFVLSELWNKLTGLIKPG